MTPYEGYDEIQGKLRELRARWRLTYIAEGGLLFLALLMGALLAFALAEGWIHFPAPVRWGMLAALGAVGGGGLIWLVLKRVVMDRTDEDLALQAESACPESDNSLINPIRLSKEAYVPSAALVREAIRESARRVGPLDLRRAIPRKRLLRYAAASGLLVVALALLMILFPARMRNAFARIALPGKPIPKVGKVVIKEMSPPGDTTLVAGETLNIRAVLEPTSAANIQGTLHYLFDGGQPKSMRMQTEADGTAFLAALRDVRVPLSYHVEIGGTESRTFRVRIVEKPTVTGIWRRYEYPEYARLEPKTEADSEGAISVLAGTAVQMKVTANKPIQSARMRLLGNPDRPEGTETNFIIEADRITLTLPTAFRVLQNGSYLVLLTDDLGNENTGSAPRKITALPDKPPEVTMAAPGKDLMMPPGSTLDLVARGTDDYGIAGARLLAWREGSKDQETLKEWSGLTGKNCSLNWPWNLDAKKYKTGDVFRYQVKMWDNNNVTGPGIGASAEYQLRIEDVEATRQRAEEKYSNWRVLLQRALEEQKSLRKEASQLHP